MTWFNKKTPVVVCPCETFKPVADMPLRCDIEGECAVIRVSRKVLAFAADNHPNYWDAENDKQTFKVLDYAGFADDVVNALNDEGEDGSTPVTRLLDAAIAHALEQGSEHVDFELNRSGES